MGHSTDALLSNALLRLASGSPKGRSDVREVIPIAESQLAELRNMRVLLEEARVLARDLAYHRRVSLEASIGAALDEVDRQIEELRRDRA
jgi:hypothetical protein